MTSVILAAAVATPEYDLVVYGSSPAAISAAVQAKRMGLKAVVVSPETRIGGLTTGGLGQTDIGNKAAFGGLALEFYRDVAAHYRDERNWTRQKRSDYLPDGQCSGTKGADSMWTFEPSAALKILEGWEKREGIEIHRGKRLDRREGKVKVEGEGERRRIVSFLTEDGTEYRGKEFVDATYEGDLMAAAGVSYTVGREANSVYGERLNGIQRKQGFHKLVPKVCGYVVPGDPKSGLLPNVFPDTDDPDGTGDRRVQAYCFRMCLTDDPENRIPFKKPANYREIDYELLLRNFEAGEGIDGGVQWINSPMPNRKTDTNNRTGFSTDFIGRNWNWAEASYAERERILKEHLDYQQGLMWTLANHPRVPALQRNYVARWGTCKDEFPDEFGDGWQRQLYVREARRMVGEYVMTEHDCCGETVAPRPVALGAYTMDSHHVRRYADKDGYVQNEGDVEVGRRPDGRSFTPYGIDYFALLPKRSECGNLLVPVCLSASHIAFGSIRMEPVFFALGQVAGTAAAQAVAAGVSLHELPYAPLKARLEKDGQILAWPPPAAKAAPVPSVPFAKAKPVWARGREREMNVTLRFTDTFTATGDEKRLFLRTTGASFYRIRLNGAYVGYGPARGPKGYDRIDEWDLAKWAKKGENALEIDVTGCFCPSYYLMEQPSYLQAEVVADGKILAATGDGAFVARELNREIKVPRYSFQRPFCEVWNEPYRPSGEGLALAVQPAKKYLPRRAAYPTFALNESAERIAEGKVRYDASVPFRSYRPILTTGTDPNGSHGYATNDCRVIPTVEADRYVDDPKGNCRAETWDFGHLDCGFVGMKARARGKGRVVLSFDEILSDGKVNFLRGGTANVVIWNLDGAGEYALESIEPYAFRYAKIVLDGDIAIERPYIRTYKSPSADAKACPTDDPVLAKIYEAARETFRQNAVDVFMDCPGRERAGWLCDSFFTARVSKLLTGSLTLEELFLENFLLAEEPNIPNGMFPMCYPADHIDRVFIPNWAMWLVLQLGDYLDRGGDVALVKRFEPKVTALVNYLAGFENADGLLEKLPSWVFVEWSAANKFTQDVNYPSNMTWARVLETVARLYDRPELSKKAERVRETIRRQSFDGTWFCDNAVRGADGKLAVTTNHTETCQYYAFFFGTATPKTHAKLWRTLVDEFGPERKAKNTHPDVPFANAFVGNYLRLELLQREGLHDKVDANVRGYFRGMAERTGTLWEMDSPTASCCHGFASYVAVFIDRLSKVIHPLETTPWIGDGRPDREEADWYAEDPAPEFCAEFVLPPGVTETKVHFACAGFGWFRINGAYMNSDGLDTLWSVYDKTVYAKTVSVRDLKPGVNRVYVNLGNGFYNLPPLRFWGSKCFRKALAHGRPCFRMAIEGVGEPLRWKWRKTNVIRNSVYLGTEVDAARPEDTAWKPAFAVEGPKGKIVEWPQTNPQMGVYDIHHGTVKKVEKTGGGGECVQVVDFGVNASGVPDFTFENEAKGTKIEIVYGERLNADGTVNVLTQTAGQIKGGNGGPGAPKIAVQRDVYICHGLYPVPLGTFTSANPACERFRPPFTWHVFRYAEIRGAKNLVRHPSRHVRSMVSTHVGLAPAAQAFKTDDADLKKLHEVCRRTFQANLIGGVQSDCPGRERLGYGGDIVATCEAMCLNFDMREIYLKILRDFADEASDDGWITETAPYVGIADAVGLGQAGKGRGGPISWAIAVPVLMDTLLRHYPEATERILAFYPTCARYIALMEAAHPSGIVPNCIGDHEAVERAPNEVTATAHWHEFVRLTATFARRLGKERDAAKYEALAAKIKGAFQEKYVKGGIVANGTQSAQAIALYLGLVPQDQIAAAEARLEKALEEKDFSPRTGIFSTRYMLMYLSEHGKVDVARRVVLHKGYPGWLFMLERGATTLWETWAESDNTYSNCHPMFGSVDEWILRFGVCDKPCCAK